jgi:CheY-like chemotaxis protein
MRRYLIVDDNRAMAENLAEIVRDAGQDAAVAPSGETALERLSAAHYDALITDMRMPVMNGARLLQEMRQRDPGLPAIVITAYTGDRDLRDAREQGVLAILPKPVPLGDLLRLLGTARRDAVVALVEDDEALADNLGEVLRDRGFTAVRAASILEAERVPSVRPFAALVDLRLPDGEDGAAVRLLSRRFPGLPVVVMTGHPDIGVPAGTEAVLRKPFDPVLLLEVLDRLHARSTSA